MSWNFARLWDWVDSRGVDKHLVSICILFGTVRVTEWAMAYANSHASAENALGIAAIIGAVGTPYMALQAAAIKFYFDSRGRV